MKTHTRISLVLTLFSVCSYGQVAVPPTDADPVVIERGPHHLVLQGVRLSRDSSGQTVAETNSYVQLTPGISWLNPQSQLWEETKEQFEITGEGYAVALKGPHQAILAPNIATPGAVSLVTPDGKRFISHVFGLSYFDPISGDSTLIAEVKDSIGQLVAPNVVIYPDAFSDFQADVRVSYTKGGFEQDIVLREQPPAPDKFGLPETSQLQILTEFIDPPQPLDRVWATNAEPNRFLIAPYLTDERLDFGAMVFGQGKAFNLNEAENLSGLNVSDDKAVPVGKTWSELAPGRQFLVESVNYWSIRPALELLPSAPGADATKPKKRIGRLAELIREQPRRTAALSRDTDHSIQVAQNTPKHRAGFNIDYQILNTIANQTLKGDTTYYVTNTAILSGVTVIEGGTVVKYTNGAVVKIQGTLKCLTSQYRPAVFTSKDDDSVGETISASTGNPATNYPAATALYFDNNQSDLKYIRIAHADQAIYYDSDTGYPHYLSHAQLVHCRKGVMPHNTAFFVRNVLMNDVLTNFYNSSSSATGHVEHLTVNVANQLNGSTNITLNVTNSLLVAVTNIGTISGSSIVTNNSGSGVFESVGAANHYLSVGSSYRNSGTTNISYHLAVDLAGLTTYPPIVLTNDFTVATTLSPQARRDSDIPDLGFHYPPLDYCWSGLNLTNATLTLTNGVAVGFYGSYGLHLRTGANLISEGTPVNLNRMTRYNTVQEQSVNWGGTTPVCYLQVPSTYSPRPTIAIRFTDVTSMAANYAAGPRQLFPNYGSNPLSSFTLMHSSLRGMTYVYQPLDSSSVTWGWTNNLFERCYILLPHSYTSLDTPLTVNLRNNLFWQCSLTLEYVQSTNQFNNPSWTVKDNAFDNATLSYTDDFGHVLKSNNGFINTSNPMGGSSNVVVTNFAYASGALGPWYQSSTNLIDAGSLTNAALTGLYHHTTTLDQVKENSTALDIGFHYVAVNAAESEVPKLSPMYPDASSSYDTNWIPSQATNGVLTDPGWHNQAAGSAEEPAWLRIDLGSSMNVTRVGYTGREGTGQGSNGNGVYRDYRIYVTDSSSTNAANWGTEVAAGQWLWQNGQERRDVEFSPKTGRYVIFRRITADGYHGPSGSDPGYANANEIWIYQRNSMFSTPLDYDSDGLPDYFEDRNGNGSYEAGEFYNWQAADTDSNGLADLQQFELTYNVLVNDPNQDYGNEQNTQFESTVAVLNGNVIVAYVDSNQGVFGLGIDIYLTNYTPRLVAYSVSRDSGVSFQDKGVPPRAREGAPTDNDGDAGDPVLAVDTASEFVYLVGTSPRNAGWNGIPLWKSTDGGVTFGQPTIVRDDITNSDKPWIAVDNAAGIGQHDVYVTCTSAGGSSGFGIWLTVSTDSTGTNWSTPTAVQTANEVNSPIIVVDPNHTGYVFWFERTNSLNYLKVRQVLNRGTNLGSVQIIRQLVTTNTPNGNLQLLRSNTATNTDTFLGFALPVPAVNPVKTNHLYVAYADRGTNSNDKADIFFVCSTNGGTNWTSPVRVNTVWTNDQWMPVLVVKPDGTKLFMAWYDRRGDTNNSMIDVYSRWGTIASNGDVTFYTNDFRITTTNFPPVFAGTDTSNIPDGHYDPVYPPNAVNLHWHYDDWPTNDPPFFYWTGDTYIRHVGEYNGVFSNDQFVWVTWTDYRLPAVNTIYARKQSDIRLVRLTWPE